MSLILLVCLYAIVDALAARGVPEWKASFALFCLVATIIASLEMHKKKFRLPSWLMVRTGWAFLLAGLFLLPALIQDPIFWAWVVGDFAITCSFGVMLLATGLTFGKSEKTDRERLMVASLGLSIATLVAFVVAHLQLLPEYARANGRHDAPQMLLIAFCCMLITERSKMWMGIFGLTALMFFTFTSGWRATFILIPAMASLSLLFFGRWNRFHTQVTGILILATTVSIGFVFALESETKWLQSLTAGTRFSTLLSSGEDHSAAGRMEEAQDILENLAVVDQKLMWFTGMGHGATFVIKYAEPEGNVSESYDGRVHHIHIGIFLVLYRYGFIGLAIYCSLLACILIDLYRIIQTGLGKSDFSANCFLLAAIGIVIQSMVYNVWHDPVCLFCIAGFLVTRRRSYVVSDDQIGLSDGDYEGRYDDAQAAFQ